MSDDPALKRRKAAHDALLAAAPAGTTHGQDCEFCTTTTATNEEPTVTTTAAPATAAPTEAEIQAQIAAAVEAALAKAKDGETLAALTSEVAELKAENERLEGELTKATEMGDYCVAEREQLRGEVAGLTTRATEAEQKLTDAQTYAEALAAREQRLDEVKALKLFSDQELGDMAESLATMSDEVYASSLASYKVAAAKAGTIEAEADPLADRTGLDTTAAASGGSTKATAASKVTAARAARYASTGGR